VLTAGAMFLLVLSATAVRTQLRQARSRRTVSRLSIAEVSDLFD